MLYLRIDQAQELLRVCTNKYQQADPKQKEQALKALLAIRYFMLNGFSPMEVLNAHIENMDPVLNKLFLPKRHWKHNCLADVDGGTVRLQIIYSGLRKKGPLIRGRHGGHPSRISLWHLVKTAASQTDIVNKEKVCPLVLKRTYARIFLKTPGNTIIELKESFSHKTLAATARYLRFTSEEVRSAKDRMMNRFEGVKEPVSWWRKNG